MLGFDLGNHVYMNYDEWDPRFVDLEGCPLVRTPRTHPYSYDPYVTYKGADFQPTDCAVYSDRMISWGIDKFNRAIAKVWHNSSQWFDNRSPKSIEKFLSIYFNKKVHLTAVLQGCNVSNGYPYWIFYYKEVE